MSGGAVSKGDSRFLISEILAADRAIRAGNRDRYFIGRRSGLATAACRMLRVDGASLNHYMEYVHDQVVTQGEALRNLEEPTSWIRSHKV